MARRQDRSGGFSLTELMIVVSIISILALIGIVNYSRARARTNYSACVANLRTLGTAAEMYAQENGHHYATTATQMVSRYVKTIPTCPAVGFTTYSAGYISASKPDAFTIVCSGSNHGGITTASHYPQWTSSQGLREP